MSKYLVAGVLASVMTLGAAQGANAQSIDYGLFETMFGEPVTTSATGKPQRVSEVSLNMEIITQEEIKRTGARTIPDAIRHIPGINVFQMTETQQEVAIRGLGGSYNDRILVLINGRQVFMDYYGLVVWDSLPVQLNEIRQIEVVKGPNTALFGFNAVGGVINIVTYNPMYDDIDAVTAELGTHEQRAASLTHTFKAFEDKLAVRYSFQNRYMDEFDADPATAGLSGAVVADEHSGSNSWNGSITAVAQVADATQVEVELTSSDLERNELVGDQYDHHDYKLHSHKIMMKHENDYGLWNATFYRNDVEVKELDIAPNNVWVAQLSNIFTVGNDHVFRLMGEYRDNRSTVIGLPSVDARAQFDILSASAMWNWNVKNNLSVSNTVRWDTMNFDYKGAINVGNPFTEADYDAREVEKIGFNSGLTYQHDEDTTIRASVARGIDIPSFLEFSLQAPPFFVGNPDAPVTVVTNYEVGMDYALRDYNAQLKTAMFFQKVEDQVGTIGGQIQDIGDQKVYGIEIAIDGTYKDNWTWGANYSWAKVEADQTGGSDLADDTNPQHVANLYLGYNKGKWDATTYVTYYGDYESSTFNGLTSDPYGVDADFFVNARVAYQVNEQILLEAVGKNILKTDFVMHSGSPVESEYFVRGTYNF